MNIETQPMLNKFNELSESESPGDLDFKQINCSAKLESEEGVPGE